MGRPAAKLVVTTKKGTVVYDGAAVAVAVAVPVIIFDTSLATARLFAHGIAEGYRPRLRGSYLGRSRNVATARSQQRLGGGMLEGAEIS